MSLLKAQMDIEEELNKAWSEYVELHKKLDTYKGREIGDDFQNVNNLLSAIQEKFIEMYPTLAFITNRSKMAKDALSGYEEFKALLITAGATEHPLGGGQPLA